MKRLEIRWQRLISSGETCPRCSSTEKELEKAIHPLKQSLTPLGIEVVVQKDEMSIQEFEKDPLRSNQIWVNKRPLEDWLAAQVGQSPCCEVCGPSDCRTLILEGETYETIPAEMIVRAGLFAASELMRSESEDLCCLGEVPR